MDLFHCPYRIWWTGGSHWPGRSDTSERNMTHGSISPWTDQSDCSEMTFLKPTQRLHGKRDQITGFITSVCLFLLSQVKHCRLVRVLCYMSCYAMCVLVNWQMCVCRYMVPIVWMPMVIYLSWYCYTLLAQETTRLYITSGVWKVCFKTLS